MATKPAAPATPPPLVEPIPDDWTGPTVVIKGVERPDHTEPQDEADARRAAWEKAHRGDEG